MKNYNRGGYPDGVFEHTADAPWNEYDTVECAHCGRFYYPAERPRNWKQNETYTDAPQTDFGCEYSLCETCETETRICKECGETETVPDGAKPCAVDGCAACRTDAPCIECGAPLSVCECENVSPQCYICGARQFSILGTLANCVWYRCRNCGADVPAGDVTETRAAVSRAADISESIDCETCDGTGRVEYTEMWKRDGTLGGKYPVTFSEECDECNGTGIEKGE